MRIGILGTGTLAGVLARRWAAGGHAVRIGGRSMDAAHRIAGDIAQAAVPRAVARDVDAVLLAITWPGVPDVLASIEIPAGVPLIDPTNAVSHGVGELSIPDSSAAERIAALAPEAHVVKAFHLFPAQQWTPGHDPVVVPLAGDHPAALSTVAELVCDAGARPHVFGGLRRARQLEELAGAVIGLAFAGIDPRAAVPGPP